MVKTNLCHNGLSSANADYLMGLYVQGPIGSRKSAIHTTYPAGGGMERRWVLRRVCAVREDGTCQLLEVNNPYSYSESQGWAPPGLLRRPVQASGSRPSSLCEPRHALLKVVCFSKGCRAYWCFRHAYLCFRRAYLCLACILVLASGMHIGASGMHLGASGMHVGT